MWLAKLDPDPSKQRQVRLKFHKGRAVEKNWVPFVVDGELYVAYSLCPHVILRCNVCFPRKGDPNPRCGVCERVHNTTIPGCAEGLRGGSPLVPLDSTSLIGIAHTYDGLEDTTDDLGTEVAPGAVPKYVHQLYRVRRVPPFDVLALSPPFRFPDYFGSGDARDKLQYAMGLRARAVAAAGSASSTYELEVAYGVGDCVGLMHTLRGSLECLGLE